MAPARSREHDDAVQSQGSPSTVRAAWLLGAVSVALAVAAATLHLAVDTGVHDPRSVAGGWLVAPLVALSMAVPGAVIAVHRPRHTVGWLFHLSGLVLAAGALAYEYALVAYADGSGGRSGAWALWTSGRLGALSNITLPFVFLLTPTGRLPSRSWRPVAFVLAGLTAVCVAASLFWAGPVIVADASVPAVLGDVPNPAGLFGDLSADGSLAAVLTSGTWLAAYLVGTASLVWRWRRAPQEDRARHAWVGSAALVALPLSAAAVVSAPPVSSAAEVLGAAVVAGGLWVALVRHGLYDVRPVLRRSLLYGALSALVVGVYVVLVSGLGRLVPLGGDRRLVLSVAVTGLVAVGFAPVRERLQGQVDRLVYGERATPYRALARLGALLEQSPAAADVPPAVVRAVAEALRAPYVAIESGGAGPGHLVAAHGAPGSGSEEGSVRLPLVSSGEVVGELVVASRGPGERYGDRDLSLLGDLARHVAGHVHAAVLVGRLQASRTRLVTAREEERRRLRRDLHDGVGPTLASLALQLDAVRRLHGQDPARVPPLVASMRAQVQTAVVEVRRVVDELRPRTVDDLGLEGALRGRLVGLADAGMAVELATEGDLTDLPAAVEVAAYLIVSEGVANVMRHASARSLVVRVRRTARGLELDIADDGLGIPVPRRAGVGLESVRERADELGGTWRVASRAGGGTRVSVCLPVPHASAVQAVP